jgi:hypothetical protein
MRTGGMADYDDPLVLVIDFIDVNGVGRIGCAIALPRLSQCLGARERGLSVNKKNMIWGHQFKKTFHISRINATYIFLNDLLTHTSLPSVNSHIVLLAYANEERKATLLLSLAAFTQHDSAGEPYLSLKRTLVDLYGRRKTMGCRRGDSTGFRGS